MGWHKHYAPDRTGWNVWSDDDETLICHCVNEAVAEAIIRDHEIACDPQLALANATDVYLVEKKLAATEAETAHWETIADDLADYAEHLPRCRRSWTGRRACDCGFTGAMASYEAAVMA